MKDKDIFESSIKFLEYAISTTNIVLSEFIEHEDTEINKAKALKVKKDLKVLEKKLAKMKEKVNKFNKDYDDLDE